ncbi:M20 family metallopeptidase [Actinoallomurus sp. NBC_01490]|uniref:M20 metallopeptidase family protein n=1 Tax=Actinoallomurus sp. NBC_01490 TaxID=2903557 RepID=UPI002E341E2B|nr:M20 family metallopeptidase [Actinoallomurus sp. NBC_01490]
MTLRDDARALSGDLVRLRREIHADPEIGLRLPRTQQRVLAALDGLPLEVKTGGALDSVTAVLRGGAPGPAVLLRGDMDALPVVEKTGLPYASSNGAMHACGHDLHTAGLVGAARLLSARRERLAGDVIFMFQPGEEGYDGAGQMIAEGVLEAAGDRPVAAYGVHVSTEHASGMFHGRPGTLMAASATFDATVHGAGGHGSRPHDAKDPVPVAAELITALQTMVTRRFDVFDPVVVTVGRVRAGEAVNVIPDHASLGATVRAFSPEAMRRAEEEIGRVLANVGRAHGVEVALSFEPQYPATVTDPAETAFAAGVVEEVFGSVRWEPLAVPKTGAEDFSRVLAEVPGTFVFLGAHDAATGPAASNHSPLARFDDTVIADAATLLAELAIRRLAAS